MSDDPKPKFTPEQIRRNRWVAGGVLGLVILAGIAAFRPHGPPHDPATGSADTAASVEATPLTDEQEARLRMFVDDVTRFIALHEVGHMIIGEYNLHMVGNPEEQADSFAASALLPGSVFQREDASGGQDARPDALISVIAFFQELDQDEGPRQGLKAYLDIHPPSAERGDTLICLMVGAEPDRYRWLADEMGLTATRREACRTMAADTALAWRDILTPLVRKDTPQPLGRMRIFSSKDAEPVSPWTLPVQPIHIGVFYHPVPTDLPPEVQARMNLVRGYLTQSRSLEAVERLLGDIRNPAGSVMPWWSASSGGPGTELDPDLSMNDYALVADPCIHGAQFISNAMWIGDARKLVICYAFEDRIVQVGRHLIATGRLNH